VIQFAQANKKRQNQLDIVYLKGIRCECSIGVWEWEKQLKQTLLIDLELEIDNQQATKNDDLEGASSGIRCPNTFQSIRDIGRAPGKRLTR